MIDTHKKFYTTYYKQLEGATIDKVELVQDEYDSYIDWPTLHVTLSDGSKMKLEVSQDEEGNGAGFLFGLPLPQTA